MIRSRVIRPSRRRARWLLAPLVLVGACTSQPFGGANQPPGTIDTSSPFEWRQFGTDHRVQTGNLEVPVDYTDPSKGTFDLFVARHLAEPSQRIGSLLVNPGGPGLGGSDYALFADQVYSEVILQRFDIVGWDPRGTGLTDPAIDCIDDYDRYFTGVDITPDTAQERQLPIDLTKEFTDLCVQKNAASLPYVGTNNSARDMNAIREALGEATISYFGFSYGSELGATWATLFPHTVRAAVLDGAIDPTVELSDWNIEQSAGFEQSLTTFLDRCSGDSECAFHSDGDASAGFDALMATIDEDPLPTRKGRPDLTRGMALDGVSQALYLESLWPQLETALAAAAGGDGSELLDLFDQYYRRRDDGSHDNLMEAFQVISCEDSAERLSVEQADALVPRRLAVAPRYAPATIGSYMCTFFPPSTEPSITITGAGAGPILVMGTTGDPATPLAGTEKMADQLEDGRLVVVDANDHTGYTANACSRSTVDRYLVDPVANAPADGTRCG